MWSLRLLKLSFLKGSLPGEEASCESLESLGEGHKGCMVNQSTSALLLKLSHMLKSENITVSGSLLLQTKLNNDFPKEKGWEADTPLTPKSQVICVMWPDGLSPQPHNPLKLPHAALVLNLASGVFQNARHLRHVIQSRVGKAQTFLTF